MSYIFLAQNKSSVGGLLNFLAEESFLLSVLGSTASKIKSAFFCSL